MRASVLPSSAPRGLAGRTCGAARLHAVDKRPGIGAVFRHESVSDTDVRPQASGRLRATPVRRGTPEAWGPSCGRPRKPRARLRPAIRARGGRHPAPRRPRGRPRARRRRPRGRAADTTRRPSAGARAPSRRRRRMLSSGCSSARPQTTRRFGSSGVHCSRKSHLRRSASRSVTSRSAKDAARGIPGVPPPEPTSTIGPSSRSTSGRPRSASSRRARRASSGSRSAVRPGVARSAVSQRSRRSAFISARVANGSGRGARLNPRPGRVPPARLARVAYSRRVRRGRTTT